MNLRRDHWRHVRPPRGGRSRKRPPAAGREREEKPATADTYPPGGKGYVYLTPQGKRYTYLPGGKGRTGTDRRERGRPRAPPRGGDPEPPRGAARSCTRFKGKELLTMDTSGPPTTKDAARCDNSREMRNAANRRDFQRGRRPRGLPRGHARPSVAQRTPPLAAREGVPATDGPRHDEAPSETAPRPPDDGEGPSQPSREERAGTARGGPTNHDLGSGEITRRI